MEVLKTNIYERQSICDIHGEHTEKGFTFFSDKVKWAGCNECNKIENARIEEELLIKKQILEQEKIQRRLNNAGIPLRFREKTLLNFIADTPEKEKSLAIAKSFLDNFKENHKNGRVLIFSGKAGTGKTHLSIAIALGIMPRYTAMYINALDAVRMIRDTWRKGSERSENEVLELLGSIDLLVIDEVGVQYGTENEQMLLFDIINRRYRDQMPMIILTNLNVDECKNYLTERSFDRLRENGQWVTFDWESYRGKK